MWLSGIISEVTGPVSYTIELTDGSGRTVRRYLDHVRRHHDVLPEPLLVPEQVWNLLVRVGVMQQMCNRNKILIQAHQSPKSQRRYPIRQRHPLRDSVTLIYCFLLGERNVMNVMIVHAFLCNFFLYINYSCSMHGSSIYTRHTLLCTALISLLNNPLDSTLLQSQNITASTTTSAKIPHQTQMIEHTSQCMI